MAGLCATAASYRGPPIKAPAADPIRVAPCSSASCSPCACSAAAVRWSPAGLEQLPAAPSWLVALALGAQIVIISVLPQGDPTLHHVVHLSTYALTAAFALLNRRVPGVGLAAIGGVLNLAAITSNGGVMPASASALRIAGFTSPGSGFANSAAVEHAHLAWLGDVFALPASWPVHNVFSVGDVLLVTGILIGLHVLCGTAPARRAAYPVTVEGVELVPHPAGDAVVQVATVPHRGMATGDLLVGDGAAQQRLRPLPGTSRITGYEVPASLLGAGTPRLALALPNASIMRLATVTMRPETDSWIPAHQVGDR